MSTYMQPKHAQKTTNNDETPVAKSIIDGTLSPSVAKPRNISMDRADAHVQGAVHVLRVVHRANG